MNVVTKKQNPKNKNQKTKIKKTKTKNTNFYIMRNKNIKKIGDDYKIRKCYQKI